mgnify:CR=1 FL=1
MIQIEKGPPPLRLLDTLLFLISTSVMSDEELFRKMSDKGLF